MSDAKSPFYEILTQIIVAAENNLHLIAISMSVALPDICVSLSSEDGRSDGKRYKEWCAKNLTGGKFGFVTPDDLYSMRCGVLHNGRFGDLKHSVARVIFMPPGGATFTNCVINDAYIYSVTEFCRAFTDAVYLWHRSVRDDPIVVKNIDRLMQYRVGGFENYIQGATVIA